MLSQKDNALDDAIYGCGVAYFFNGYNTNLKLAYNLRENSIVNKAYSQLMLSLQIFIL